MLPRQKIAVVKLGSLGDFVQATGPFAAIRLHHPDAHLTLITTPPYAALGKLSGWFDDVWVDGRPNGWMATLKLIWRMRRAGFSRVYDLQTSNRSSTYFQLLWPGRPEWSGVATGCSHPHANPDRVPMHTIDRQAEQLLMAGIPETPPPNLDWARSDISKFDLQGPFVLIVPGGSAHRPAKRWPADAYAQLAAECSARSLAPVILGATAETEIAAEISSTVPDAVNLVGQTQFEDIVGLAAEAKFAVGNDTGPMHLAAVAGAPSLVLFSSESDPVRCAPRGDRVVTHQVTDLHDLSVTHVTQILQDAGMLP